MIAQFTAILAEKSINIDNFLNSSKGDYAYSMIDIPSIDDETVEKLKKDNGVIKLIKI